MKHKKEMYVDSKKLIEVTYSDTEEVDNPNSPYIYEGIQKMSVKGAYDMMEEILRSQTEKGKLVKDFNGYLECMHQLWFFNQIRVDSIPLTYSLNMKVIEE